jgi:hypothetical protein
VGVSKFPKLRLLRLWGPIILCANLQLKWGLKNSYSFHGELSNDMWHSTCTRGNHGNFWLLVVWSQITNLIPDPSFGHNLCLKCWNGDPISNIYISIWVCNCPLKIWKSIGTPIPKVKVHLGVWKFIPSHFFAFSGTWNVIPKSAPSRALALVTSPRLGLRQLK